MELKYFKRQLPVIGEECQKKLLGSSVLVAGAGGLGSTVSELLVRAGVGEIHIVDNGIVDEPDLNRQILYDAKDIGKEKVFSAKRKLEKINGITKVFVYYEKIDENFKLPENINIAIDCLDNFKTRYILDSLLEERGIPLVHAGIESYFIQLTVVDRKRIKSLRDIFPEIPDKEKIPVIGPTAVIAGALQSVEVIKHLCEIDGNLSGKLLIGDLRDYEFNIVEISK